MACSRMLGVLWKGLSRTPKIHRMRPRSIPLLLVLLSCFQCGAQNAFLDSCWKLYRAPGQDTRSHLETLHEIVWELSYVDADSAKLLAMDLLQQATAHGNPELIALAHRDLGDALAMADRNNDAALKEYRTAIAIWRTRKDSSASRGIATALNSMGMLYKNRGELDTALAMYQRSLSLQATIGNVNGLIYSNASIARIHEMQSRDDSALYYYTESGHLAKKLGDERMVAASAGNRANVYERMGQIGPAIDLAYECLRIMEKMGNDRGVATTLTTLSSLAHTQGDEKTALSLMRKANALYTKVGYKQGVMTSGNHIGTSLLGLGKMDSSIFWLERALLLEREFEAKDLMGQTLNNLANAYRGSRRFDDSERIAREALELSRVLKDGANEAKALSILGRSALDKGMLNDALKYCNDGYAVSKAASTLTETSESCECLYRVHKARGDGMRALIYLEEYHAIQDSIISERNTRALTQRDMQYTFGKEQLADSLRHAAEVTDLDHARELEQLRADRNRNRALGFGGTGVLLIAGVTAFFISDRKRRKARFEKDAAQLETQALRSQMNPHFIFNALNSINAYVQKNEPDRAASFLSRFARLMRLVLENSRQAEVPLKDDLEALEHYLHLERARSGEKFDYAINVDPVIDQEDVFVPPLVAQPFVENAIWHGMSGKEGKGHITLAITRQGEDLIFTIDDDGVGRHAPKHEQAEGVVPKKSSLGTAITQARLDLVSKQKGRPAGYRYVDKPSGTRVELTLPLSEGA